MRTRGSFLNGPLLNGPVLIGALVTALLAVGGAACGADGESGTGIPGVSPDDDGGAVTRGRELNVSAGCAACHGSEGGGGVGPAYVGLAGTEVELDDGTVVVADTAYIRRSIVDPAAEVAAGWEIPMPPNSLSDDDVDALVAWIESL